MKWKLIVTLACLTVITSYAFIFREGIVHPYFLSMPYLLWTGILSTAVLVALTYLGAKHFTVTKNKK